MNIKDKLELILQAHRSKKIFNLMSPQAWGAALLLYSDVIPKWLKVKL